MTTLSFKQITLKGEDAGKFLQSQVTVNIIKLNLSYQPAAIADLKGRIQFGIWIKKQDENQFDIVISSDCLPSLQAHIKKYGAFSKFTTSDAATVYPCVLDRQGNDVKDSKENTDEVEATFSHSVEKSDLSRWMALSIASGNYWIVEATQGMFQPQELRLHQRGGVDYDKGCYLGQEVIARIYFKASPKAFLHRVKGQGRAPNAGESLDKIKVVNAIQYENNAEFEALVVARPEQIEDSELELLPLPVELQGSVAREA